MVCPHWLCNSLARTRSAAMRRARPYRGENNGPGKDIHAELDPTPGIREQPGSDSAIWRCQLNVRFTADKQTSTGTVRRSDKCQERTNAAQQTSRFTRSIRQLGSEETAALQARAPWPFLG